MANKAFRYRLYPNKEQQVMFMKTFGCCRFIYNKMLADKKEFYEENKQTLHNTPAQYKDEFDFLKEVDSLALANEQMHLQTAFGNFFRDPKIGYPKFKSRHKDRKSYTTNNAKIKDHKLYLPKIGIIKFIEHRQIPKDYLIKSATISLEPSGKFYISILTEYQENIPIIQLDKSNSIGLDYSSPDFYVDNQNVSPEVPKFFRKYEEDLARAQRKLSHMKLHSKNYEKQKTKVNKIHKKISDCRKDWVHKLSTSLCNFYDYICLEDINFSNMKQTLNLGKATSDNGFGMFRTFLEYKQHDRGHKVIYIDKWYPSSQICSECGYQNPETKDLSLREWICPNCGTHHFRDQNAAINILKQGLLKV